MILDMFLLEDAMATIYRATYVSLNVRRSNRVALCLYRDTLGFTVHNTQEKYCEDICASLPHPQDECVFRCRWRRRLYHAVVAEIAD